MAPPGKAPTMDDVGRRAGCHASTVSLALRGDPRIPAKTRERVQSAAAELGYRVHPLISAWVSARRASRPVAKRVAAAYLTCHPRAFQWQADHHFRSIFEGACERAERYGFSLTQFRVTDYARNLPRLNQVLVTRNVQALIIGPALEHHELRGLDWDRFSLVTIGYGLTAPAVHRVTEDHHLGMKLAFESCLANGHRRIGLALVRQHNAMRRERWIGAYLYEQNQHLVSAERLPIYIASTATPIAEATGWLQQQRPDIVLADDPAAWRSTGVATLGFALSAAHDYTGVHENNRGIGSHAADLMVSLVLRNERGIPAMRQTVLVEPSLRRSGE
ncbi:MAG: LacI family DNA-binding transcriptional regulator [Opitutaceae bacterium]|nr:LacI family DNA-binding transcriptional regulator [Opitutaceae bacterium]